MRILWRPGVCVTLVLAFAADADPARAETIHLRNGTLIRGKITKQDELNLEVETLEGKKKVLKQNVANLDIPDPFVSLLLGATLPGVGNAYTRRWDKAIFYFAVTAVSFAAGFAIVHFGAQPSTTGPSVLGGSAGAALPWAIGAWEAYTEANQLNAEPKFWIDY